VCRALRHADVQARVEDFACGTRFAKDRFWHVEVAFEAPVERPIVIGDGRFLGLGVMAPQVTTTGIHVFSIESGVIGDPDPESIAQAMRRAVMARVQAALGDKPLPAFFSGHEPDGGPTRKEAGDHLAFVCDITFSRLLVVAPHVVNRREPTREERRHEKVLEKALEGMRELRAGKAGCLVLRPSRIDLELDPFTTSSRVWESATAYNVNRHLRVGDASGALAADLKQECRKRGLPAPASVLVLHVQGVPGQGLGGRMRLEFNAAVRGPLLLGKSRHLGGGMFLAPQRKGGRETGGAQA
jgi:CRISPR-associated protein Csb2